MAELVTIGEFSNSMEAHVLKTRLESEGIKTYLIDENINSLLGFGISLVKLQVNLHDSFKAMDLIYDED